MSINRIFKVIKLFFSLLIMVRIGFALSNLFGNDSIIVKLYLGNYLFSTYNIASIILIICAFFGVCLGKKMHNIV